MTATWASGWVTGDVVTAAEFAKGVGSVVDSTLGVASASIDFTGLPTTYAHLLIEAYLRGDTAAGNVTAGIRFNNDSGANYNTQGLQANNTTVTGTGTLSGTSVFTQIAAASAPANAFSPLRIEIPHYAGSVNFKGLSGTSGWETTDTAAGQALNLFTGIWKSTAAINRVTLIVGAGNFAAGSRVTVYAMGA